MRIRFLLVSLGLSVVGKAFAQEAPEESPQAPAPEAPKVAPESPQAPVAEVPEAAPEGSPQAPAPEAPQAPAPVPSAESAPPDSDVAVTAESSSEPAAEEAELREELGEVVVTAERRESSIQKTPVAVSAVGVEDIRREGVKMLADTNGNVPGLFMSSYPSNMQPVSIRGIGANDPGTFSAVGYYLDDVYLGRSFGRGSIALPDIERIEILRGPQGTLYGQSTSAGAIKFVSRNPSLYDPYNWVSVAVGNYRAREAYVYLSAPIVRERLSAGIAYAHRQNDGDHYNAFRQVRVNRLFVDQIRGKLRWSPLDELDIVLTLDSTVDSSDNFIQTPNNAPVSKPRLVYANVDTQMHRVDLGQTLVAQYDINEHFQLKSVSAHRRDKTDPHPWDQDGLPEDIYGWNQKFTEEILNQELQLNGTFSSLTFTAGANVYDEKFDFWRLQWLNGNYTNLISRVNYRSYAGFAQANYRIIPRLGITLGARYGWEKQKFNAESYVSNAIGEHLSENYRARGLSDKQTSFTPKAGIDFQVSENVFTYVSYTFGQKSGGFNRAAGTLEVASIPVAPEKVRTAELGVKTQFFAKRLTFNATGFYNDFDDYQASVTNPVIDGRPVNGSVIVNAGSAHTYGVELEAAARPAPGLQLRGNATFLRTKFDSFVNPTGAASSDFTGNELPNAPKFTGALGFSYTLPPFGIPGALQLNGTASYIQRHYTDIANRPITADNRTWIVAGLDYTSPDQHWNLSLQVKNLLNKTYVAVNERNPNLGTDTSRLMPPRTILGTVRYQF